MLRVIGVNNPNIQQRLLAELSLTLKKATEIAQALEMVDRGAADLQSAQAVLVHSIEGENNASKEHARGKGCRVFLVWEEGSHGSGMPEGKDICKSRGSKTQKSGAQKPHKANTMVIDDSLTVHTTFKLRGGRDARTTPLLVSVKVEGKYSLQMEVDTGASVSLISEATFKKTWTDKTPKLGPTKVTL
ncbi:hypothetical protein EMCRGX_G029315 [Ephydatia muelleri]